MRVRQARITLERHLDAILTEKERRYEQRWASQQEAIDKAEKSIGERLNLLNELREDVVTTGQFDSLAERVHDIKARLDKIEGSGVGKNAFWGYLIGAGGMATALVTVVVLISK